MLRRLLPVAAAFAVGLGVGYLLQPRAAADRRARPESPTHKVVVTETTTSNLREQLLALPGPEVPSGDGSIRGCVRDDAGAPLAGALVVAWPLVETPSRKVRKGAAGPEDRELEDVVREIVSSERGRRDSRRSATSGPDGSYEITGLALVPWSMRAFKEGYQFQPVRSTGYKVEPGATVDFAGSAIVRVEIDVRMPDGTRPARATIRATSQTGHSTGMSSDWWTAEEPWIELKPQAYELTAEVRGAVPFKSDSQFAKVEPGATSPLVLQLKPQPALQARAILPEGVRSTGGLSFWALRFVGEKPPEDTRLRADGRDGSCFSSDERSFVFQDIEPGTYLVGAAYSSNNPVVVTQVVEVGAGLAEVNLRFPPLDPSAWIVARARDPEGAVPRDVRFLSHGSVTTLERDDGAFLLLRREAKDGTVPVTADSRVLGRIEQTYDPARPQELVFAFEKPAFVNLDVVGYAKSPLAGWLAFVLASRGASLAFPDTVKPRPEGMCRLGPVQPGAYDIRVYSVLGNRVEWLAATIPVDLASGEQTSTVNLPPIYTVTIRWPGGSGERTISLSRREFGTGLLQRKITEEVTTIERVPAGHYEIQPVGGGNSQPIEFDVPAQVDVTIK